MPRRTVQVHMLLSPGEFAALEAVRANLDGCSQADAVAYLCRLYCAEHLDRPGCGEALHMLGQEGLRAPARRTGRPPTPPKVAHFAPKPKEDPVRPGARFVHREWRWKDGTPYLCEVLAVTADAVRFRHLRRDGKGLAAVHSEARDVFERRHVGKWLPE